MSFCVGGPMHLNPESLPPGCRFQPSDEELIDYYSILPQLLSQPDPDSYIKVIQLNNYDPWDLFAKFKSKSGEKELHFFTPCEYYKRNGHRKRKAGSGQWKSKGRPRLITRGGSVIGTKRTFVFHNPDGTPFVITEFVSTADPSLPIKGDFMLCRLHIQSSKRKIANKKARLDCKKKTRPNKKAAFRNENSKEMNANSANGEDEPSFQMASHLQNQFPHKMTRVPVSVYEKGESSCSAATRNPCDTTAFQIGAQNLSDISTHGKHESRSQNALHSLSKMAALPNYDKGEAFSQNVADGLSEMTEKQYQKADVLPFLEDYWSPSMSFNAGETVLQVESQYEKDNLCVMASEVDNATFPKINPQFLEEIMALFEDNQNSTPSASSLLSASCVENQNPYEITAVSTNSKGEASCLKDFLFEKQNPGDRSSMFSHDKDKTKSLFTLDFGSQNPCNITSVEVERNPPTGRTSDFSIQNGYITTDISIPKELRSPLMATVEGQATFPEMNSQLLDELSSVLEPSYSVATQNLFEMTAVPKHYKSELSCTMANPSLCDMTAVPFHDNGESTCSMATQNLDEMSTISVYPKADSTYSKANQNVSEMAAAISIYQKGESNYQITVENPFDMSDFPALDNGESTYPTATQNLNEMSTTSVFSKADSTYSRDNQNASEMAAISIYQKGESNSQITVQTLFDMSDFPALDKGESTWRWSAA